MLRQGGPGDFGFIRALAGRAEYRPFITDEDEAGLQAYLDAPDCEILIWEPDGQPAGYAIFCEIGHASGRVELMRLALDAAGQGAGRVFLRALVDRAFGTHGAQRVWLDCSAENLRAQKTYVRAGFVQEARLRSHDFVPVLGRNIDTLLYGMLRAEWQALEPLPARA
ncbi:MAG: GNAT family N-acetyltransferase [Tabrizicola sp.]|jgi:RimJ/RimL family protein N-acetyltransferase|nr:GNAT family N-acetyltransferase [Tabrizicola sp.]